MPLAATTSDELTNEVNTAVSNARKFVAEDSWQIKQLLVKADRLIKSNAPMGHSLKASIYALTGSRDRAIYHADNAISLSHEPILYTNKASVLANLGFFSEAQQAYKQGAAARLGFFGHTAVIGLSCGAFQSMAAFISEARRLQMEVDDQLATLVEGAVRFLNENNTTEKELAGYLDVAGELLREHRAIWMDKPDVAIWDDDASAVLQFEFKIPFVADESERIDTELVSRLAARYPRFPDWFALNFKSGLPSHERYADGPTAISA